ncbi:MAG TPA: hemerythrin domain-containing protein, partial [Gammaproteobacteria bacterium]
MNVLDQLKLDHENVTHLLDILDNQLERIHELKRADIDLIRDIMHYMIHYPDRVHHPMEDLVIERLVERDPSAKGIAENIEKEHRGLAKKSQAFHEIASNVADGAMVLREELENKGHDYVGFLRSHMQKEDEKLFPLAEKMLTKE